jgi:hypothetical protein
VADARADVATRDSAMRMDSEGDEVLAICRAALELPLGFDDEFVEAGAHSIAIAKLMKSSASCALRNERLCLTIHVRSFNAT